MFSVGWHEDTGDKGQCTGPVHDKYTTIPKARMRIMKN